MLVWRCEPVRHGVQAKFNYEPDYHAASAAADVEAFAVAVEKSQLADRPRSATL